MKITKDFDRAVYLASAKMIANENCKFCPTCGDGPIWSGVYSIHPKGFFNIKLYKVNHYSCDKCNTEWKSDPYEYC